MTVNNKNHPWRAVVPKVRKQRSAWGQCPQCGADPAPGKKYCELHHALRNAASKKRDIRNRTARALVKALGLDE